MSITFGFITEGKNDDLLRVGIQSIKQSGLVDYEIIVLGNTSLTDADIMFIAFDDSEKPGWITKKKNLLAVEASKDVLVIMHDYLALGNTWNMKNTSFFHSDSWDVAVCRFENLDGTRWCDWHLWPFNTRLLKIPFRITIGCLIPYNLNSLTNLMYVNGTVIIVKRHFFLSNPLDETKLWGQEEDVEWSIRIREHWKLVFAPDLFVKSLKLKLPVYHEINHMGLFLAKLMSCLIRVLPGNFSRLMKIPYK
jgi:hypothetical protein